MAGFGGALFGLGAAGAFGLSDVGGAVASRRVGSAMTTAVVVPGSAAMITALFVFSGAHLPPDLHAFLLCALGGVCGSFTYFAAYAALRAGPITIVIPVMFAYGGLTAVLSVLFLGESPTLVNMVAVVVATTGVVLAGVASGGGRRIRLAGRGVGYALVVVVAAGAATIVGTLAVRESGWLPALTFARLTNATIVVSVLLALSAWRRARPASTSDGAAPVGWSSTLRAAGGRVIGLLIAIAALETVAVSVLFAGFEVGPTWLVALTSSFAPAVGLVAGVTVFHERPRRLQWSGIALVLGGAVLLAIR